METQDIIILISAITVSITTIIGAFFAGWAAIRQNPQQNADIKSLREEVDAIKTPPAD